MNELDEIKRRKLAQMQAQAGSAEMQQQLNEQLEMQKKIEELENIVKLTFTKKALERYGNVKAVDPEKALKVITVVAQLMQRGRIQQVSDELLKDMLRKLTPQKKEFMIRRA